MLGDRPPTVADLPRLKYTESVVNETLRVYPTVWVIGREAIEPVELGGYLIPAGTTVFMPQWVIHRDGRWFDDPEAFRPERWADGLIAADSPLCLLPLRRRTQDLHRQQFRPDGGHADPGDHRPEVPPEPRARCHDHPSAHDDPAAGTWSKGGVIPAVNLLIDPLTLLDPLQFDHVAVETADGHQLGVAAGLDDRAVVEDKDAVGMANRAQAMGDHERRPAVQQLLEALLDQPLALAVQVAGGFVEDEDPGIGQNGSRDCEPLALTAAQAHSCAHR